MEVQTQNQYIISLDLSLALLCGKTFLGRKCGQYNFDIMLP